MGKSSLVKELRYMDFTYDKWGTALNAHFSVCEELMYRGSDIPSVWEFRPGVCHVAARNYEEVWTEILEVETDEALIHFGNILHRYVHLLERHGHGY
jgi:hypothetical protein